MGRQTGQLALSLCPFIALTATHRWRLLEACLCAINNEEIVEAVETSSERGTPCAFDGQALLTTILPPILTEPGM